LAASGVVGGMSPWSSARAPPWVGGLVAVVGGARAAGGRDFGADDEEEFARVGGVFQGGGGQGGGAGSGDFVGELRGFSGAAFGAVEVDLGEACGGVVGDHTVGFGHGVGGKEFAPGLRAKVVAAEEDATGVHLGAGCYAIDKADKIGGRQTGVAAVLVDLVRRRLDDDGLVQAFGQGE
jgi:hypothetical protein